MPWAGRAMRPGRQRAVLAATLALVLAACGGGGDAGTDAHPPSAALQALAGAAVPTRAAASDKRPAASTDTAGIDTGWYWNPAEGGSGFMFEAQGHRAFVGFFLYEEGTGKPIWYVAYGEVAGDEAGRPRFTGDLRLYLQGQPLSASDDFRSPRSVSVGEVRIPFSGRDATALLPGGRTMTATRFDIAGTGYDFDRPVPATREQPEVGWYWNPLQPGRGYAIEVQNNRLFMAAFHYHHDGTPTWNIVDTDLSTGAATAAFMRYADGQSLTSAHRAPRAERIGDISLVFRSACGGMLQFDEREIIAIRRFRIDDSPLPPEQECRAFAEDRFPMPRGMTATPARVLTNVPTYGYFRAPDEVHVYADSGSLDQLAMIGDPRRRVELRTFDGRRPPFQLIGTDFYGEPSYSYVNYVVLRAAEVGLGPYRLLLVAPNSQPSHLLHGGPHGTLGAAGDYAGDLHGRRRATLTLSIGLDGSSVGELRGDDGQPVALVGQLTPARKLTLTGPGGLTIEGDVARGGLLSATWRDDTGPGGVVSARRQRAAVTSTQMYARPVSHFGLVAGLPEAIGLSASTTSSLGPGADPGPLKITWTLLSAPANARPTLDNTGTPTLTFTADVPGRYRIGLTVEDPLTSLTATNDRDFIVVAPPVIAP